MKAIFFILLWFNVNCILAFRLELYDEADYNGLFYNRDLSPLTPTACENLPPVAQRRATSLKTEACIVVYTKPNCEWYSYTITQGDHPNLNVFNHTGDETTIDQSITSFHLCNENIGGIPGALELYGYHDGRLGPMVEYRDLCGCINTPKFSHGHTEKINNFGNCFEFYNKPDCPQSGNVKRITIMGGHSTGSNDLGLLDFDGEIRSLKPCDAPNVVTDIKCGVSLQAVVKKIEITDKPPTNDNIKSRAMSSKTVIRNDGPAEISQDVTVTKELEEVYEVERSQIFTESIFKSFSIHGEISFDAKLDFIPFISPELKGSVEAAYNYNQSTFNSQSERVKSTTKTKRVFTVTEKLGIPACTEYSVSSILRFYDNLPVDYILTVEIKGKRGLAQLNYTELADLVPGATRVDDITVEYTANGVIYAEVGFEATITGVGKNIPDCTNNYHLRV